MKAVLDEIQTEAVESDDSMIVIAGPGSGKTRVLTEKARKLMNDGQNVICVCFTRAAAAEMASRVPNLPATTVHSFCCQVVGWRLPRGGSTADGYAYMLHRFLLQNDFKFDWVLIDECQDLNPEEVDVVFDMVGGKIFAVGDPFQSIYGFQGAIGPDIIGLLKRSGCQEVPLRNNYRSSPEIVKMLNDMFDRGLVSRHVQDTGLTAVLCRRNDDVFEVSRFLEGRGTPHRICLSAAAAAEQRQREWDVVGSSNLRLMTIHGSKGREFDNVVVYNWMPDQEGEEVRVLYVGIARASKSYEWVSSLPHLEGVLKNDFALI